MSVNRFFHNLLGKNLPAIPRFQNELKYDKEKVKGTQEVDDYSFFEVYFY